jgi:hypothetical protein
MTQRRFPPPWKIEEIAGGYVVKDANGQSLAYVYGRESRADAENSERAHRHEVQRIATNIAKLPSLLNGSNAARLREVSFLHHFTGLHASPKDFVSNGALGNDRLC